MVELQTNPVGMPQSDILQILQTGGERSYGAAQAQFTSATIQNSKMEAVFDQMYVEFCGTQRRNNRRMESLFPLAAMLYGTRTLFEEYTQIDWNLVKPVNPGDYKIPEPVVTTESLKGIAQENILTLLLEASNIKSVKFHETARSLLMEAAKTDNQDGFDVFRLAFVKNLYDQAVIHDPAKLPSLFPIFASLCGHRGRGQTSQPNIKWELIGL